MHTSFHVLAEDHQSAVRCNCSIEFLPDAKHLSVVEKSAFADIIGKAAWSRTELLSTGT